MNKNTVEIWEEIDNYPNYMVSNMGKVKSLNYKRTGEEKILKPCIDSKNYCIVNLRKDKKHKKFYIHRLVAKAFIPNPDNKPYIDHINTDRTDNRMNNLRWVTQKENCNNPISKNNHSKAHKGMVHTQETKEKIGKALSKALKGRKKSKEHIEKCAKAHQKPILQFSKDGEFIKEWASATQAGNELGIAQGHITQCCKGRLKTCGGYIWRYADEYEKIHFNVFDLEIYRKKVS